LRAALETERLRRPHARRCGSGAPDCKVWAKLIKIGAKVVSHGRYITFQMAQVAVSRQMFVDIPSLIARLRAPPVPA
jgi:hypothetical protein